MQFWEGLINSLLISHLSWIIINDPDYGYTGVLAPTDAACIYTSISMHALSVGVNARKMGGKYILTLGLSN